jgi:radical SAM protein with 4Fe4S-binding SPASM domain
VADAELTRPYRRKLSAAAAVAQRAAPTGAPYSAMVEIADRCNEACVHCYQIQGQKGELTTEEWQRIFDELASLGVVFLTISGGEPTLRKDFLELVTYARKLRFAVKVYSNALNITEHLAQELGRLAVQEVQISLYSHRAEIHDAVTRVPGSFDRIVAATACLRAAGVKVLLKSPVMRQNEGGFSEYIEFVTSLGADYALDPELSPREDGDLAPTELGISKPAYFALMEDPRFGGGKNPVRRAPQKQPCGACSGNVHIEANGEMRPCTQWNVATGQATDGLTESWRHDPSATKIRSLTWDDLVDCRSCALRDYCQRCFADAELYTGNALLPYAKACRGARWQYERLSGVEPEIDSEQGHCATPPVGPFVSAGEHRFTVAVREGRLSSDASTPPPVPERSWLGEHLGAHSPPNRGQHQLVQIRRKPAVTFIPGREGPSAYDGGPDGPRGNRHRDTENREKGAP